ncbi:MAG: hypothetical protein F4X03_03395 [Dehalococcoidia bacterium]|nr:hypothetical protein [Dehalococcoidia bacterium]
MTTEDRLRRWLASEHGIAEPRRLAREDDDHLLVSKFPPGFIARVGETVERLDLLVDPDPLAAATADRARRHPREARVEGWRAAACDLVRERAADRGLTDEDAELVTAGIESVAALMHAVLWSEPLAGDPYEPAEAERDAWRDALVRTEGAGDIFTRHYGAFEGRAVVAHCPGAPYARALLESAWRACTGTPPPA